MHSRYEVITIIMVDNAIIFYRGGIWLPAIHELLLQPWGRCLMSAGKWRSGPRPLPLLRQMKGSVTNIRVLVHTGPGDEKRLCEEHHEPNCRTSFVRKQKTSEAHRPSPSLTLPDAFPWHHPQIHQSFLHVLLSILPRKPFFTHCLQSYPNLTFTKACLLR